jgi:hypothetical protein
MKRALVLLVLAGCPAKDTYISVRAFSAPRADAKGFVAVFHPWSVDAAGQASGTLEVLAPIEGFEVTCVQPTKGSAEFTATIHVCKHASPTSVTIETIPPAGVELTVTKAGFEPVKLTVTKSGQQTFLVILRATPLVAP